MSDYTDNYNPRYEAYMSDYNDNYNPRPEANSDHWFNCVCNKYVENVLTNNTFPVKVILLVRS